MLGKGWDMTTTQNFPRTNPTLHPSQAAPPIKLQTSGTPNHRCPQVRSARASASAVSEPQEVEPDRPQRLLGEGEEGLGGGHRRGHAVGHRVTRRSPSGWGSTDGKKRKTGVLEASEPSPPGIQASGIQASLTVLKWR